MNLDSVRSFFQTSHLMTRHHRAGSAKSNSDLQPPLSRPVGRAPPHCDNASASPVSSRNPESAFTALIVFAGLFARQLCRHAHRRRAVCYRSAETNGLTYFGHHQRCPHFAFSPLLNKREREIKKSFLNLYVIVRQVKVLSCLRERERERETLKMFEIHFGSRRCIGGSSPVGIAEILGTSKCSAGTRWKKLGGRRCGRGSSRASDTNDARPFIAASEMCFR